MKIHLWKLFLGYNKYYDGKYYYIIISVVLNKIAVYLHKPTKYGQHKIATTVPNPSQLSVVFSLK